MYYQLILILQLIHHKAVPAEQKVYYYLNNSHKTSLGLKLQNYTILHTDKDEKFNNLMEDTYDAKIDDNNFNIPHLLTILNNNGKDKVDGYYKNFNNNTLNENKVNTYSYKLWERFLKHRWYDAPTTDIIKTIMQEIINEIHTLTRREGRDMINRMKS